MKVMCIRDKPEGRERFTTISILVKGEVYNAIETHPDPSGPYYELAEDSESLYAVELFAPVSEQYADITAELARQVVIGDTADRPVKILSQ